MRLDVLAGLDSLTLLDLPLTFLALDLAEQDQGLALHLGHEAGLLGLLALLVVVSVVIVVVGSRASAYRAIIRHGCVTPKEVDIPSA